MDRNSKLSEKKASPTQNQHRTLVPGGGGQSRRKGSHATTCYRETTPRFSTTSQDPMRKANTPWISSTTMSPQDVAVSGLILQHEVVSTALLFPVLHGQHFVYARTIVRGVSAEGDLKLLQEAVHTIDQVAG